MDGWHDAIGLLTFGLGSLILYFGATRLSERVTDRRTIRRVEKQAA